MVGYYADGEPLVGVEAARKGPRHPLSTLSDLKALLALPLDSAVKRRDLQGWTFKPLAAKGGGVEVEVDSEGGKERVRVESAWGRLVRSLVGTAQQYTHEERVTVAALAVSVEQSLDATLLALTTARALLPNVTVALVDDAVCVALAHGLDGLSLAQSVARGAVRVCVVDVGSTLRLTELEVARGMVRVQRSVAVAAVQSAALEHALIAHLLMEFERKAGAAVTEVRASARAMARFRFGVGCVWWVFVRVAGCVVTVEGLFDGRDLHTSLTRARFDALAEQPLWRPVHSAIGAFLAESHWPHHDAVLLSGGLAKLPRLQLLLAQHWPPEALKMATVTAAVDPTHAVALGAALYARSIALTLAATKSTAPADKGKSKLPSLLAPNGMPTLLPLKLTSLAIGIAVRNTADNSDKPVDKVVPLISADTPLPIVVTRRLRVAASGGERRVVRLVEYAAEAEHDDADDGDAGEGAMERRILMAVALPLSSSGADTLELTLRLDADARLVCPHLSSPPRHL